MLSDEMVEEADTEGGGAFRHGRRILLRPGRAGDVEMRPRRLVDEALQELRRGDAAAGPAAADVLHIRGVAVDLAVISLTQGHAPERLAHRLAGGDEALGELLVIGKEPSILVAERDDDGAGQRRQIDRSEE